MLSVEQLQALELLSNGYSQVAVADKLGLSRRTVVRWLSKSEFKEALKGLGSNQFVLNEIEKSANHENEKDIEPAIIKPQKSRFSIKERLNDLIPTIIDECEEILKNPDTRTGDKLKSAAMLAKWAGLEERPDSVEQAFEYLAESKLISMDFVDFYIEGMEAFKEQLFTKLKGRFEDV